MKESKMEDKQASTDAEHAGLPSNSGASSTAWRTCCGEERYTHFCPDCGRNIARLSSSVNGLLVHLRESIKKQRSNIQHKIECKSAEDVESYRIALGRWESWERELVRLMDAAAEMNP